jgi:hypothetical protein
LHGSANKFMVRGPFLEPLVWFGIIEPLLESALRAVVLP